MTAWVDDPDLSMSITSDLINALADAVYEPDQIKPIVLVIGLHAADMPWRIARETWLEVVREAAQHGKMRALVEHMRDHFAMLEERMTRVLSTSRAGGVGLWYQCANPKQARLLGSHSQKAMIDRYELSDDLDELMSPAGRPILLISGDPVVGRRTADTYCAISWTILDRIGNGQCSTSPRCGLSRTIARLTPVSL